MGMENGMKILLVFDFDKTIVELNTDRVAFEMIPVPSEKEKLSQGYEHGKWTEFMKRVFQKLYESGIYLDKIEENIKSMNLMKGMKELFDFIKENPSLFECIVISDSNSWFIHLILHANGLDLAVKEVFTNKAEFHSDKKLIIYPCHQHEHMKCPVNMCKGNLLERYLQTARSTGSYYDFVCYIGDGGNDFCPSTKLTSKDYVFPRKGFELERQILDSFVSNYKDSSEAIVANVVCWENGLDILKELKSIAQL